MSLSVSLELNLPEDWKTFHLPKALDDRLQDLLDRQDTGKRLSPGERREAKALVQLVDILVLLKAKAALNTSKRGS